jgi:hypothetical protein
VNDVHQVKEVESWARSQPEQAYAMELSPPPGPLLLSGERLAGSCMGCERGG